MTQGKRELSRITEIPISAYMNSTEIHGIKVLISLETAILAIWKQRSLQRLPGAEGAK